MVTIGLCTRNSEKTIFEAISSVVEQDFPHELMELIVVDANSQDKTLSIIKKCLSKTSIQATFFSENVGLGFARQMVVDHAKGDYIVWVDSDVILSRDYIKQLVAFIENNPSVGTAVGSFGVLATDNWVATLENVGYVIDSLRQQGKSTSNLLALDGTIMRVKALRQVGGFDQSIKGAKEDADVGIRLRDAGWKSYVTAAVFFHRQRTTWKGLWKQHFWYGYGLHYFQSTHQGLNIVSGKTMDRIVFSFVAYKLTHRKVVFLLPLNFVFKKTALVIGFMSAHMDGYGHAA
jgi:cellulose synthase/poly-beta-1,6-N-acetylglucosamine synthase-like glycosyltransferase